MRTLKIALQIIYIKDRGQSIKITEVKLKYFNIQLKMIYLAKTIISLIIIFPPFLKGLYIIIILKNLMIIKIVKYNMILIINP